MKWLLPKKEGPTEYFAIDMQPSMDREERSTSDCEPVLHKTNS